MPCAGLTLQSKSHFLHPRQRASDSTMARLHIHPVGLGLIFFGLLSWVVALGGLGVGSSDDYAELLA